MVQAEATDDTVRIPLIDMGDTLTYYGFVGGLYPDGNAIPAEHLASRPDVTPIDDLIVVVSIGMSNAAFEFCASGTAVQVCTPHSFMGQVTVDEAVNPQILTVNGAQNSQTSTKWLGLNSPAWTVLVDRVQSVASLEQVLVCWVKNTNHYLSPPLTLPDPNADAYGFLRNTARALRNAKTWFPNLGQCYLSSRIYAGYASQGGSIEPVAYETGFGIKWLIEAQMRQLATGEIDTLAGDMSLDAAPWIAWGPYVWADAANPRSDGLTWIPSDYLFDLIHPDTTGVVKVATSLVSFFKTSPATMDWFLADGGEPNVPPTAGFTIICTDLACDFTDASLDPDGTVANWDWDFGDGNTSTAQHPSHTYAAGGTYPVTLTATDNLGAADIDAQDVTVAAANTPPVASFTVTCTDLACDFTDASVDPDGTVVGWDWDFGDGNTSTAQHPSHTYAAGGTYPVTLTATDDLGASDVDAQDVIVTAATPSPITLTLLGFTNIQKRVRVSWDGAVTSFVQIYRDGVLVVTTQNDGLHTDILGTDPGTAYEYQVCEVGTEICSDVVTVTF
jgi:PKD repeat protein